MLFGRGGGREKKAPRNVGCSFPLSSRPFAPLFRALTGLSGPLIGAKKKRTETRSFKDEANKIPQGVVFSWGEGESGGGEGVTGRFAKSKKKNYG